MQSKLVKKSERGVPELPGDRLSGLVTPPSLDSHGPWSRANPQ
jgi:hypothetical protein